MGSREIRKNKGSSVTGRETLYGICKGWAKQSNNGNPKCIDPVEFLPAPSTTVFAVERWNKPQANIYRTLAVLFAFIVMGANDAAYGVSGSSSQAYA